jgi:drug/metabolite transporter (DMT)-like permease
VAGILLALAAIVLISFSLEESGVRELSTRGLREALLAGLIIGGFFAFNAQASPSAGLHPLLAARVASIVVLGGLTLATRATPPRDGRMLVLVLGSGLVDMAANALYVLATFTGALSIAVVLSSLYPASTVFLARLVLGERLAFSQKVGVGLALAGVALIALR